MSAIKHKRILLAVSGSIAAYKSVILLRELQKRGAEVRVIMTPSAAKFVAPLTFASLSQSEVYTEVVSNDAWNNHVELGLWADAMIIAPCTANTLAGMAHGLANNIILAVYLSAKCPVYYAPAMDRDMWKHPTTTRNRKLMEDYGIKEIPIGDGYLASGLIGEGRMAEPEDIADYLEVQLKSTQDLLGVRLLMTAGPTREYIDPVRFVSNPSTGKMGIAIAEEASKRGAEVTLILGPTNRMPEDKSIDVVNVITAQEMYEACINRFEQSTVAIMTAAVADYRPANKADQKIKKKGEGMQILLERTLDIAGSLGAKKKAGQVLVGFALETQDGEANAAAKVVKKNFDFIVLNTLADSGAGFGVDTNKITIIDKNESQTPYELKSKKKVATDIVNYLKNNYL